MEKERQIIHLSEYEIAPILDEYAYESGEYDDLFDNRGELKEEQVWSDFLFIEKRVIYRDIEAGYEEYEVITQRISDGKFFRGFYTISPFTSTFYRPNLKEVFPEQQVITVYI